MNIVEVTKKALEVGKGIINTKWDSKSYYLLPTNTDECYLLIPIGFSATEGRACPRWNPQAKDILSEDWEVYEATQPDMLVLLLLSLLNPAFIFGVTLFIFYRKNYKKDLTNRL